MTCQLSREQLDEVKSELRKAGGHLGEALGDLDRAYKVVLDITGVSDLPEDMKPPVFWDLSNVMLSSEDVSCTSTLRKVAEGEKISPAGDAIGACIHCRHLYNSGDVPHECVEMGREVQIDPHDGFPEWCPLDDVTE